MTWEKFIARESCNHLLVFNLPTSVFRMGTKDKGVMTSVFYLKIGQFFSFNLHIINSFLHLQKSRSNHPFNQSNKPMKKILFVVFAAFLVVSANSQPVNDKGVFDNAVYIRAGYSFPGGTLKSENIITTGAQFEVGTIFYINALNLPEKLKLGIDATYLSLTGLMNREAMSKSNETVSYVTAGCKVGPCISYNFSKDWLTDIYFKLQPNYFITGQEDVTYTANNQFKFGTSFGMNIRWKFLMIGCEFTSAKYDFDVATSPARSNLATESKSIQLPVTNLSLGVNF
jgi:hypothetical protein